LDVTVQVLQRRTTPACEVVHIENEYVISHTIFIQPSNIDALHHHHLGVKSFVAEGRVGHIEDEDEDVFIEAQLHQTENLLLAKILAWLSRFQEYGPNFLC
jgi:hypothetical protein